MTSQIYKMMTHRHKVFELESFPKGLWHFETVWRDFRKYLYWGYKAQEDSWLCVSLFVTYIFQYWSIQTKTRTAARNRSNDKRKAVRSSWRHLLDRETEGESLPFCHVYFTIFTLVYLGRSFHIGESALPDQFLVLLRLPIDGDLVDQGWSQGQLTTSLVPDGKHCRVCDSQKEC